MSRDLRRVESHFAFGENWQSFAAGVTEEHIADAVRSLERLLPREEIAGRRIVDIGCGSGLTMLAAARLGAASVEGVDIDNNSVSAAQALLSRHLAGGRWSVRQASVFDLSPAGGTFDVVHSWGVLHHTGDMAAAIRSAAALVAPGGRLAIALYRKTPLCGAWRFEKRLYSAAPKPVQAVLRAAYKAVFAAGLMATGRNPIAYVREYKSTRGMDWSHDVHDWLGGYPYESVEPKEIAALLSALGFDMVRMFEKPAALGGLLGSHCDEFVAIRRSERDR